MTASGRAAGRRFVTLDVFTGTPLAGNPLAVVLDAQGLDGAAMQAVAREFNLSETVFVLAPKDARHRARLRIFTPASELPFASHPTLGSAILLGQHDGSPSGGADAAAFGLEVELGTIACIVEATETGGRARLRIPSLPRFDRDGPDAALLAPLLGLTPKAIGFGRHQPSRHTAGPSFTFVPVADQSALTAARLDGAAFARAHARGQVDALYLYTPDSQAAGRAFEARMFAPHLGVAEDPATGSAAAAFAGVLMQFAQLGEGTHDVAIRQGVAMGRPSAIALQVVVENGTLRSVEIGGEAVIVSEGVLRV